MKLRFWPDLILFPVIAAVTATVVLVGLEIGARILLPQQIREACLTPSGAAQGGCGFRMKTAEGPWVSVAYNACGSRSTHPCDALPADQRVVVLGSSITRGYGVDYPDMFAPRAEAMLDRACGAPVEFQNLSLAWPRVPGDRAWADVNDAARRAVALRPKMVLLFITQWDLFEYSEPGAPAAASETHGSPLDRALSTIETHIAWRIDPPMKRVRDNSRFVLGMRSFLNRDDQQYIKLYGASGDISAYMKPTFPQTWDTRVAMLSRFAAPIAAEAEKAGARFALVYIPPEPPVLLARGLAADRNFDAYALPRALQKAAAAQGWGFIDTLPAFGTPGAPALQFYRINGHPNAAGHAAIARGIAGALSRDDEVCKAAGHEPMLKPTSVAATPARWAPAS